MARLGRPVLLGLELEGELDGAGTAGLVQGVETAVGAAGAGAAAAVGWGWRKGTRERTLRSTDSRMLDVA